MSNDGGSTAKLEQAMADALAALNIFKAADVWKYQFDPTEQGGMQAFQRFAPFAFVKFSPPTDSSRQGDGDLNQHLRFAVIIGQCSKEAGVARIGNANVRGVSKFRDDVIDLFDNWHPGSGFDCDNFRYDGEQLEFEDAYNYALVIFFRANRITLKLN